MIDDGVRPELCVVRAEGGELRIDFVIHNRHSWIAFRRVDLDGMKKAVDAAIAQRDETT